MVNKHSSSRAINRLTVKAIEAAVLLPSQSVRKLSDGAGLTLTLRNGAARVQWSVHSCVGKRNLSGSPEYGNTIRKQQLDWRSGVIDVEAS